MTNGILAKRQTKTKSKFAVKMNTDLVHTGKGWKLSRLVTANISLLNNDKIISYQIQ